MARSPVNLRSMDVDSLLALRADIDVRLAEKRRELEKELSRLGHDSAASGGVRRRGTVKGTKVAPKYRGPDGDTWAGRGAQPRWLSALLKDGHKLEEFAIDRSTSASRKSAKKTRKAK